MHRYNNPDHSITAMLAIRNILGENHGLWNVNTERSFYEKFTKEEAKESAPSTGYLATAASRAQGVNHE